MSLLDGLTHIARSFVRRSQADAFTNEELEFHIAKQTEKHIAEGMSPAEARRRAVGELGGKERWREATSDVRAGRWVSEAYTDARHALRSFVKVRGFALPAIASIVIGVAVGTTLFAVADGAFLRALPFPGADRAMSVSLRMPVQPAPRMIDMVWSYPKYEMLRANQRVFSHLALHSPETLTLTTDEGAERVSGELAGADYFTILGVAPALGRTYSAAEDRIGGANAVTVISDVFWRTKLGGRDNVLGSAITIGATKYTIIGVMPPRFGGMSSDAQLWIPVPAARSAAALTQSNAHNMSLIGRLNDGVTPDAARTEMERLGAEINRTFPEEQGAWSAATYSFQQLRLHPAVRRTIQLLAIAAGLLLVLVTVNLTTLLVTRASSRRQELSVRLALGGSRARLVRQLATESAVLALIGGAAGIAVAFVATRTVATMLPSSMPTVSSGTDLTQLTFASLHFDGRVIAAAVAISLVLGGVAGLVSALTVARATISVSALRQGASSAATTLRLRTGLVSLQVALGLMFAVASGLTLQSLQRLVSVPLGYKPEGLLAVRLTLDAGSASIPAAVLWSEVEENIRAIPGVRDVAFGTCSPIGMHCNGTSITPVGHAPGQVMYLTVSPKYFATTGTRVIEGREFTAADTGTSPGVIINQAAAQALWGHDNPLTTPIESGNGQTMRVIGIVEDARYSDIEHAAGPQVFQPFTSRRGVVFVRADGDGSALVAPIRQAIRRARIGHAPGAVQLIPERLKAATVRNRLAARVFGGFGVGALLLAAIGVYGTLALSVVQRTREFAIRRALGARAESMIAIISRELVVIAGAGIVLGAAASVVLNRMLSSLLYDVRGVEGRIYALSGGVLLASLVIAAILPTLRSLRIDPRMAMRAE